MIKKEHCFWYWQADSFLFIVVQPHGNKHVPYENVKVRNEKSKTNKQTNKQQTKNKQTHQPNNQPTNQQTNQKHTNTQINKQTKSYGGNSRKHIDNYVVQWT